MWFGSKEQSWVAAELVNLIRFDETQMEFEAWMKTTSKLENSVQGWENFNKQTFNFSREHSYLDCSTWSDYTRTRCSYFPTFSNLSQFYPTALLKYCLMLVGPNETNNIDKGDGEILKAEVVPITHPTTLLKCCLVRYYPGCGWCCKPGVVGPMQRGREEAGGLRD